MTWDDTSALPPIDRNENFRQHAAHHMCCIQRQDPTMTGLFQDCMVTFVFGRATRPTSIPAENATCQVSSARCSEHLPLVVPHPKSEAKQRNIKKTTDRYLGSLEARRSTRTRSTVNGYYGWQNQVVNPGWTTPQALRIAAARTRSSDADSEH